MDVGIAFAALIHAYVSPVQSAYVIDKWEALRTGELPIPRNTFGVVSYSQKTCHGSKPSRRQTAIPSYMVDKLVKLGQSRSGEGEERRADSVTVAQRTSTTSVVFKG